MFCVRQRNDVGWSAFSLRSPIVTTSVVLPTDTPTAILANTHDAVVQWTQSDSQTFLEFKMQIGALPPIFGRPRRRARAGDEEDEEDEEDAEQRRLAYADLLWRPAHARELLGEHAIGTVGAGRAALAAGAKSERDAATGLRSDGTGRRVTQALVTQLSPGSVWAARVKVRTVAGWSCWSSPSEPFRTASAP